MSAEARGKGSYTFDPSIPRKGFLFDHDLQKAARDNLVVILNLDGKPSWYVTVLQVDTYFILCRVLRKAGSDYTLNPVYEPVWVNKSALQAVEITKDVFRGGNDS